MIKKVLTYIFIILIVALGIQFVVNFLKTEHDIDYILSVDGENANINEIYRKSGDIDYYFLNIEYKGNKYFFEIDNYFNKQKEIIQNITISKFDDYLCMSLEYIDDLNSMPLCSKDGNLYSYISLNSKYDFSSIIKDYQFKDTSEISSYSDLTINKDFLYDNENLLIYNYKEIIKIKNNDINQLTFSTYDDYKNTYGTLVGEYYVIPKNNNTPEYSAYMTYNLTNDVIKSLELPEKMSRQIYINGVYDNKLYVFDKSNLRQYEIDPSNNEITIVGTKDKSGILYKDGALTTVSVQELNSDVITFSEDISAYSNIDYDEIYVLDKYAIYLKGNNFYKVYKDQIDNPILLFSESNFKEVKVREGKIYYIKNDSLYRYDDYGILQLVKREEFKYNSQNIFDVYIAED